MKKRVVIIILVVLNIALLYRINLFIEKGANSTGINYLNSNEKFKIEIVKSKKRMPELLVYMNDSGCRSCKESIIRNLESIDKKYRENIKILYAGNFREDKLFTNFRKNLLVSKELSRYLEKNLNSTPAILFINTRGEVIFSYAPAPGASKEIDIFFKSLKKILYDFGFGQ